MPVISARFCVSQAHNSPADYAIRASALALTASPRQRAARAHRCGAGHGHSIASSRPDDERRRQAERRRPHEADAAVVRHVVRRRTRRPRRPPSAASLRARRLNIASRKMPNSGPVNALTTFALISSSDPMPRHVAGQRRAERAEQHAWRCATASTCCALAVGAACRPRARRAAPEAVVEIDDRHRRARVDRRVDARQRRRHDRGDHQADGAGRKRQRHEIRQQLVGLRTRPAAGGAGNRRTARGRRTTGRSSTARRRRR